MAIGYKDYLPDCSLPPIYSQNHQSKVQIECFWCGKVKPLQYACTKRDYAYKMSVKGKIKYFCSHSCLEAARAKYKPAKLRGQKNETSKLKNKKL